MSLIDHLRELRRRLFLCCVVLVLVSIGTFTFTEELFVWITGPLRDIPKHELQVLGVMEMFVVYLKLALMAAAFISIPWMLLQVWLFVAPGLYRHERLWLAPFVVLGTLFFVAGGAFAFYIVLPLGFEYLVGMVPAGVTAAYRVSEYVTLVVQMLLAFGLIFELPLAMWILAAAGIVEATSFAKIRKYWIVAAFVIGGVLTPPDPLSQLFMAVPLLVFFELGILGARFVQKKTKRAPDTPAPAGDTSRV